MGKEKTTAVVDNTQTQSYERTPEEQALAQEDLKIQQAATPGQIAANEAGLSAVTKLLTGQTLPGYLQDLPGGISEERITSMNKYSLRDLNNQLAMSGAGTFMESGAAQQAGFRAAEDTRNQAAQYNLNNLMQLLNIGVGGQASVQQPISTYSGQLAGLVKGTGTYSGQTTGSTTTMAMNPFLKSWQTSAGQTLGSPSWSQTKGFGF